MPQKQTREQRRRFAKVKYPENQELLLLRSLKDAGCGTLLIEKIQRLEKQGEIREQFRLLARHRSRLLKRLHAVQEKVDCLDYLLFHMTQNKPIDTGRSK